jgi:1-phosphofructokinase family hexose kinase
MNIQQIRGQKMITTVTLNPALDRLLQTDTLAPGETNRTRLLSAAAAGKGIDVAKVLRDLHCDVAATGFLGGPVADIFVRSFKEEQIDNQFIPIQQATRTNIQLFEKSGRRTELLDNGPTVDRAEYAALLETVQTLAEKSDTVAICGSVPGGIGAEDFRRLIRIARHACKYVIVDTSGKWLQVAVEEKPDLIKPNRREMSDFIGSDRVAGDEEIIAEAHRLVDRGLGHIVVSLGGEGAFIVGKSGTWRGKAPKVPVKSTVGCGDAMVASLSVSLAKQDTPAIMLQKAIALSAAEAMTFETAHVILGDYSRLLNQVQVEKIN